MRTAANGIQVNYAIDGEGPCLVMSHSLACSLEMWDPQIEALKGRYRILRFDTRGHGRSDAPAGAYSLEQLADDLHGLLQAVTVERPPFAGLSMGGMIGMTYALKYPGRLRSLALCDTSSRLGPEVQPVWDERIKTATEKGMEPLVEPTLKRWFTEAMVSRRPPVLDKVAEMIRATPPAGYIGCCHAIPKINVTARLKDIACPIQVIVGEQDAGTPVAMAREIQAAAPGSELVVIPDASHLSNLEQPEAFNRALLDFLGRVR
jgi:3-oxoadipate enol-lactonase